MTNHSFSVASLDVSRARQDLAEICRRVADGNRRVEIRLRGRDRRCVVISREELEGMERTIEILSNAREVQSLSASLRKVAAAADGAYDGGR